MTPPAPADLAVGQALEPRTFGITRTDLVRYCGASADHNPIHWNERVATEVGLPGVIAHGMLTMALAGRYVSDWAGDPGRVLSFGVRFSRPIPVPDDDTGATVTVSATIEALAGDRVTLALRATAAQGDDDVRVLSNAKAVVRLG